MKIVESEVDIRVLHSNDCTNLAMHCLFARPVLVLLANFSENFISIRSVIHTCLSTLERKKKKIKQTCLLPI